MSAEVLRDFQAILFFPKEGLALDLRQVLTPYYRLFRLQEKSLSHKLHRAISPQASLRVSAPLCVSLSSDSRKQGTTGQEAPIYSRPAVCTV